MVAGRCPIRSDRGSATEEWPMAELFGGRVRPPSATFDLWTSRLLLAATVSSVGFPTVGRMAVEGTVRVWHDGEGWGVVDSPETPGGCWVHHTALAAEDCRTLTPGHRVRLEWEPGRHEGFDFLAARVQPPLSPAEWNTAW